jgi:hypothetical protein
MKLGLWWAAATVLVAFYLGVRFYYGNVGAVAVAMLDPGCPSDAKALAAPTLSEMYEHTAALARRWNPDSVLVRFDNLAMQGPLKADGSSTNWTAGFYSANNDSTLLVHTGDGKIYCNHNPGNSGANVPKLKPDFMRDGAALYAIAEKRGRQHLAQGRGIGVVLWSTAEGGTAWILEYVDSGGYPADLRVRVDPNTGKEEVGK